MNFIPKLTKNKLFIYNASNGSIHKSITLPSNAKYEFAIAGEFVIVSIMFNNGTQRSRTYNMKTGTLKSDISI
jgi:hypothetical protein|tara:strand:- start:673 stop:891 length:219 start_codon:yes stop_codon:yes gene_type:complete